MDGTNLQGQVGLGELIAGQVQRASVLVPLLLAPLRLLQLQAKQPGRKRFRCCARRAINDVWLTATECSPAREEVPARCRPGPPATAAKQPG